ncbi:MAG: helix-turn-helix domain-containing protein [Xanthobacteraceae bacterium]|nr:helix-turn-helix domain-containing protein [Xanthobacteraceae bacterium]
MTSESDDLYVLKGRDLENFGFARVRDIAYDAVQELWRKRKEQGWNQIRLAENIGRDTGWLSRYLSGPGNWTFRTFGALVQGLDGDVQIIVRPSESIKRGMRNSHAYAEYNLDVKRRPTDTGSAPAFNPFSSKHRVDANNSVVELQ